MGRERKELFLRHGYDLKNAAHCLRLLRMGCELMETGELHVDRTNIDAEELKEIKSGKWTLGQVQREADRGFKRMEAAQKTSVLPESPNLEVVEQLVIRTYFEFWGAHRLIDGHVPVEVAHGEREVPGGHRSPLSTG
jgi:hypothetical protein